MKHPYRQLKIDGRKIDEHRYVMEQHIGRKLNTDEHVHHINGDKKDNRIENLQIMSKSEHSKHHNPQLLPLTKKCVVCGGEFTPKPTKRRRNVVCSKSCAYKQSARTNKNNILSELQKDQISARLLSGERGVDLAKEYGVSPQVISFHKNRPASSVPDF